MFIKKRDHSRSSSLIFSLFFHACILVILCLMLLERRLDQKTFFLPNQQTQKQSPHHQPMQQHNQPAQKQDPQKSTPPDASTFVVPAPVVYYGNQAMMNLPTPVAGSATGTSGFDQKPTTLPTPPVLQAVETQKHASDKPFAQEEKAAFDESSLIEELNSQPLSGVSFVEFKEQAAQKEGPTQKKVTLADLFKNAQSDISQLAFEGQTSATKAGTEGGDINGSGHQVTIKEGDMKYYTLWAKFLNHLNQSARFSRRGKENLIRQWIQSGEIQYVMHCGITIDAQGKVLSIDITHSSGCKKFDTLCLSDVHSAVPFPPLPASLGKKTARFEVSVYP